MSMQVDVAYLFSSQYSLLLHCLITTQFSYPFFLGGYLVDFQFLKFIHHAAMNSLEPVFLCTDVKIFLQYIFRSGLWGHLLHTT